MRLSPWVTDERIDDVVMAIHLETGAYYVLEGAAADCWTVVTSGADLAELVDALTVRYDVEADTARATPPRSSRSWSRRPARRGRGHAEAATVSGEPRPRGTASDAPTPRLSSSATTTSTTSSRSIRSTRSTRRGGRSHAPSDVPRLTVALPDGARRSRPRPSTPSNRPTPASPVCATEMLALAGRGLPDPIPGARAGAAFRGPRSSTSARGPDDPRPRDLLLGSGVTTSIRRRRRGRSTTTSRRGASAARSTDRCRRPTTRRADPAACTTVNEARACSSWRTADACPLDGSCAVPHDLHMVGRRPRARAAARVGGRDQRRAVVFAGTSGAGKSTTALACLAAGMEFIGDDACLVAPGTGSTVHSVYGLAKLEPDAARRLPRARPFSTDGARDGQTLVDPGERMRLQAPLRAIFLPSVTGNSATRASGRRSRRDAHAGADDARRRRRCCRGSLGILGAVTRECPVLPPRARS